MLEIFPILAFGENIARNIKREALCSFNDRHDFSHDFRDVPTTISSISNRCFVSLDADAAISANSKRTFFKYKHRR